MWRVGGPIGRVSADAQKSVVVSTKFGILPAQTSFLKEMAKPLARKVNRWCRVCERQCSGRLARSFSANNFTVRGAVGDFGWARMVEVALGPNPEGLRSFQFPAIFLTWGCEED